MADPITVINGINAGISLFKNVSSLFGGDANAGDARLDEIIAGIEDLRSGQEDILDGLLQNRQTVLRGEAFEVRQNAVSAISDIRKFENGDAGLDDQALSKISSAVAGLRDIDVRQDFLAVEVAGLVAVAYVDIINAASDRAFARSDIASEVNAIADYLDDVVDAVRAEVNAQRAEVEDERVSISVASSTTSEGETNVRGTLRIDGEIVDTFFRIFVPGEPIPNLNRLARDEFSSQINSFLRAEVPFPDILDLNDSADALRDLTNGVDARSQFNNGDNTVTLGSGNDYADGFDGDDLIFGAAGNDALRGGDDNDSLFGNVGDDVLNGEDGDDLLAGGVGTNVLRGGAGTDTASYRDAATGVTVSLILNSEQRTGVSLDLLEGIEALEGSDFNDVLIGDTRANTLTGLGGNDQLLGGRGADRLIGGPGRDRLSGQADGDTFVVQPTDAQGGPTTITDLNFAEGDRIELNGFGPVRTITSITELARIGDDLGFSFIAGPGAGTTVLLSNDASLLVLPTISFSSVEGALNEPPIARQDAFAVAEDTMLAASVADNDEDPDGDALVFELATTPEHGVVNLSPDGSFTYQPFADYAGRDSFTYSVSDGEFTSTATVIVEVTPTNDAPEIAALDFGTVRENNAPRTLALLEGAVDPDGDALSVTNFRVQGDLGAQDEGVLLDGNTALLTPRAYAAQLATGETEELTLLYDVTDGQGGVTSNTARVVIEGRGRALAEIVGTNQADELIGTDGADRIIALRGNDSLFGGLGNDLLDGGSGFDTASYANSSGAVRVVLSRESARGADGRDTLLSIEAIEGSRFGDRLEGSDANEILMGGRGDDTVIGAGGNDSLSGDAGKDRILGGEGKDTVSGGSSSDSISGDAGNDVLNGDSGRDTIEGGDGKDTINGGTGSDSLSGSEGKDVINGDEGNDNLSGGDADDRLNGGTGNDRLAGDDGRDRLNGGTGNDVLWGGAEGSGFDSLRDIFIYSSRSDGGGGSDRIEDFEDRIDRIDLTSFGFSDFAAEVEVLGRDTSAGLRLDFGGGDTLLLVGFDSADFDSRDVLL